MKENSDDIVVSVSMVTYNHEKYIAKAIESVLVQKTNFKIELVIGEDCSKDNTRAICVDYKNKNPEIINLRLYNKNVGMATNAEENLKACKGKYIALLDGDDYWVDDYKLQKQVDALEKDPSLIGSFTNYSIIDNEGNLIKERALEYGFADGYIVGIDEFLKKYKAYPTCTVMFRVDNFDFIPNWFKIASQPDTVILSFLHLQGDFIYLDDVTLHYRKNPNSITNDNNIVVNRMLVWFEVYEKMLEEMPAKYHKYYSKDWGYIQLLNYYATNKKIGKLVKLYFKFLWDVKPTSIKKSIKILRDILYLLRNNSIGLI